LPDQGKWVRSVIQGFSNHHAVPGNRDALDGFRTLLARSWFQSLRRPSQKAGSLKRERMQRIIDKWLPHLRILHPYPNQRLRYTPEIGAHCISNACWDLCGGCRVTGIPTATTKGAIPAYGFT